MKRALFAVVALLAGMAAARAQTDSWGQPGYENAPLTYNVLKQHGGQMSQGASGLAVTSTGSTTARTLATRFADVLNAKDYGVKCDGTTDDTTALQAFFNAAGANARGDLPAGTCLFSSGLTISTGAAWINGQGPEVTTLKYTGAGTTTDLLFVGSGTTSIVYNVTLSNFRVDSSTTMTAGAAIHAKYTSGLTLNNVYVAGQEAAKNLWDGWYFEQNDRTFMRQFVGQAQDDALRIAGYGVGTSPQYDWFISHGKLLSSAKGIHVGGGTDNIHFDFIELTQNNQNVVIDHTIQPYKNQEVFFGPNVVTDQAQTGDNYYIDDSDANQTNYCNIVISGAVTNSKSGYGIHVKNWPSCFVTVNSPYIYGNNKGGFYSEDASTYVLMSPNTLVFSNGADGVSYGIGEGFASSNVLSLGQSFGNNGNRNVNTNVNNSLWTMPLPAQFGDPNTLNTITFKGYPSGQAPTIAAAGVDANQNLKLKAAGTGCLLLTNGQVNYGQACGAATGSPFSIYALGSDANVSLNLIPKGTGTIQVNGTAGVSCGAGTVNLSTLVVTDGIITHC